MVDANKATHRGYLIIAGAEIPCAVLENKKRVISQTGLFKSFERPRKGEVGRSRQAASKKPFN
jgi:hypothetical protein